jgi:hypothetical protein
VPSWAEIESLAPELASHARSLLEAHVFKAMGAEEPLESHLYRADVTELAVTRLTEAGDELAIDFWSEAAGLRSLTRK